MFAAISRRRIRTTLDRYQLLALRQVIRLNRSVAWARCWLQPVEQWLWLMPAAFLLGMVSVMLIRLG
jgi:hypothetical protein